MEERTGEVVLSVAPTDSDQGSNLYVVTYLTRKHGVAKNDVFFDYGTKMEASAKDLKEGSFSGIGDNMKWAEIFWKFTLDGKAYVLQAPLNSPKMGLANSGTLLTPPSPSVTKLPDGSVLSVDDLKGLKSYPFQDLGTLRDAKELARDGQVTFVDASDKNGQDHLSGAIATHLKSSNNIKNMFGGLGPEFVVQKSLMFAGAGSQVLKWPDGTPDVAVSKRVAQLLGQPETADSVNTETKSKFEAIEEGTKNKRFSGDDDSEVIPDTKKTLRDADRLNKTLNNIKNTAVDLGLSSRTAGAIPSSRLIMGYLNKRAALLEKEKKNN